VEQAKGSDIPMLGKVSMTCEANWRQSPLAQRAKPRKPRTLARGADPERKLNIDNNRNTAVPEQKQYRQLQQSLSSAASS